ncbi:hypothetical protein A5893_05745 [Pedobacter psychrophilus]|uniref:Uncharacterized protein n=1 Tax=Pedobacter psychrophilus TaxID=1826909 RepID=A0A179DHF3_9SPHI|nr:hypothetical protein [Pedobacter psychrophilus]OAQ40451.1 hypothetical protein A5893_05745 [Pedobacter psychrophilus]
MKNIISLLTITIFLFSCNSDSKTGNKHDSIVIKDTSQQHIDKEEIVDNSENDKKSVIDELQGKWVRVDYPFSIYEFKNSQVKLTEEGLVGPLKFKDFNIQNSCVSSESGSSRFSKSDMYLYISPEKSCYHLSISNDTLTLGGTDAEYSLKFKKKDK